MIEAVLSHRLLDESAVKSVSKMVAKLVMLRDNYTCVIQTVLYLKRASLILSKKLGRPIQDVTRVDQQTSSTIFDLNSPDIEKRLLKYVLTECPTARSYCLKVLLDSKSKLLATLVEID